MGGDCKMPKGSRMEQPRMNGCFKDACSYRTWRLAIPVMIHSGWKIPQLMAASFPLSSPSSCNYALAIALPRLHVHAVRMESGSCERVAFASTILHS